MSVKTDQATTYGQGRLTRRERSEKLSGFTYRRQSLCFTMVGRAPIK